MTKKIQSYSFSFLNTISQYCIVCWYSLIFLQIPFAAQAQDAQPQTLGPTSLPPSPEASQLARYGSVPVGFYTGAVQVSVPIVEVKQGPLHVPIALNYASTNNKVEEVASWVGLGWTLQVGGTVTRVMRGRPDDTSQGGGWNFFRLSQAITYSTLTGAAPQPSNLPLYWEQLSKGCYDAEPDLFYFNFPGCSGSFMFDWDHRLVVDSDKPVVVEPVYDTAGYEPTLIQAWRITAADGTVYTFAHQEITSQAGRGYSPSSNCISGLGLRFISSWQLTAIADVNREHKISLEYDSYQLNYGYRASESAKIADMGGSCGTASQSGDRTGSVMKLVYTASHVRRITTSSGNINVAFNAGELRTDTLGLTGSYENNFRSLASVVISNAQRPTKTFRLAYYATNTTGRLSLRTVQACGADTATHESPYQFVYHPVALPTDRRSYAQDHWGFYNGALTNLTLLPTTKLLSINGPYLFAGANREVSSATVAAGLLTRVTYPTGGFSEFTYEPNDYSYIQSTNIAAAPQYTVRPQTVGVSTACDGVTVGDCQTQQQTFTITPNPADTARNSSNRRLVSVQWSGYTYSGAGSQRSFVKIIDASGADVYTTTPAQIGSGVWVDAAQPVQAAIYLPSGTYTLIAYACNPRAQYPDNADTGAHGCPFAAIGVTYDNYSATAPILTKLAGGARVKQIRDYARVGDQQPTTRRFSYADAQNAAQSSGCIYAEPRYNYTAVSYVQDYGTPYFRPCSYTLLTAHNVTAFGNTQGSHIGYRHVEVIAYDAANAEQGKTAYDFTSPAEYPDAARQETPFTPVASQSYLTGLVAAQTDYAREDGRWRWVKQLTNIYQGYAHSVNGEVVAYLGYPGQEAHLEFYEVNTYATFLGHAVVQQTQETLYGPTGNTTFKQHTATRYNPSGTQRVATTQTLPNQLRTTTRWFYPEDYQLPTPWQLAMVNTYHVSTPLETTVERTRLDQADSSGIIVQATGLAYQQTGAKLRVLSQHVLETATPITQTHYAYSAVTGKWDARLRLRSQIDRYDGWGNVGELHQVGGSPVAQLWGYAHTLLQAEAKNCQYAQLATTSFEEDATGRWYYDSTGTHRVRGGRTGRWAYRLNGQQGVMRNQLPAGDYELSFWLQNAAPPLFYPASGAGLIVYLTNGTGAGVAPQLIATAPDGWHQYRARLHFTNLGTIILDAPAGGATPLLDEVRLYPVAAQLTTYTYEPTVGVTSHTDPMGRTVTYEYDSLNRLVGTRDEQGRILSQQQYHYAGPK